ncbi:hypothetical protein AB0M12_22860, partial [Nocardia vinacea]|uniref:hypothetical protein n=1 Tax=Nocardia vinacea TaxID=96468 RepID=UPI0034126880
VIGGVDDSNDLFDIKVIPPGSFATDWTAIAPLSGDRVLYYSASKGRGVIGGVDDSNDLFDIKVIPPGSFATD